MVLEFRRIFIEFLNLFIWKFFVSVFPISCQQFMILKTSLPLWILPHLFYKSSPTARDKYFPAFDNVLLFETNFSLQWLYLCILTIFLFVFQFFVCFCRVSMLKPSGSIYCCPSWPFWFCYFSYYVHYFCSYFNSLMFYVTF